MPPMAQDQTLPVPSYQEGEVQQAARHGRRVISYQFLWDALGLTQ